MKDDTDHDELDHEQDNRPPRYVEVGPDGEERVVYRASSLMMCDRVFIALSENYTPASHPDWFQEVLDEGTRMESKIISLYEETFDAVVTGGQTLVEVEVIDGVWIRGHIDGMEGPDQSKLFEAKKIRESMWGKFKRSGVEYIVHYPWQLSFYMHGLELDEAVVVGGLYNKDKDTIDDLYVHSLTEPPIPWKAIVKRIAYLEALVNKGNGVDDVKCNVRQFPCPFFYLHDPDDEEAPPKREVPEELVDMIKEREEIKARVKVMQDEAKPLEARVKEINGELERWMRKASIDDDQFFRVDVEDQEMDLKYHTVHRRQYTVGETDYTLVTVKLAKKATPKATPKATTKKLATKKG